MYSMHLQLVVTDHISKRANIKWCLVEGHLFNKNFPSIPAISFGHNMVVMNLPLVMFDQNNIEC